MGWWENLLLGFSSKEDVFRSYRWCNKTIYRISLYIETLLNLKACSSVDRASDSDSGSRGFDSLHAYK